MSRQSITDNNCKLIKSNARVKMHSNTKQLPDITNELQASSNKPLEWVGMEKIGLPAQLKLANDDIVTVNANVDVYVSLDTASKGIHMSRIYLKLYELLANKPLSLEVLNRLLDSMLQSHLDISESAKIKLQFDLPLHKKALLSENFGYQLYSVTLTQQLRKGISETSLEVTVPYSSTCPCSASLANQLNGEAFARQFSDEMVNKQDVIKWLSSGKASLATPHNQRSYAYVNVSLSQGKWINVDEFIIQLEGTIGTPVQTAVKREDEQEFARINGDNLMFCEDAARKVKQFLEHQNELADYWFKVEHQESLHAHNAVVIDRKR
jgi:GTP cyclohydrolase I